MKNYFLILSALLLASCQQLNPSSQADSNLRAGQAYMAAHAKQAGVTATASGVQFKVLRAGGKLKYDPAIHGAAPTATVMYRGTLIDGTVFDQSESPIEFDITRVIPGFTEALKAMPIGSIWEVTIPAHLAYGEDGPANIGPNATLIFQMQLLGLSK